MDEPNGTIARLSILKILKGSINLVIRAFYKLIFFNIYALTEKFEIMIPTFGFILKLVILTGNRRLVSHADSFCFLINSYKV